MLIIIGKLAKRLNPLAWYGPCWCLTVFRWGRRKVELCYAPADYEPPEHVHPNSDGEFLILWAKNRLIYRKTKTYAGPYGYLQSMCGNLLVCGDGDYYTANVPPWRFKTLSVRAGTPHAFKKGDSFMLWICFETWKKGAAVTSVAEDFVLT